MSKGWKYGLILVQIAWDEEICELVELYPLPDGEYHSFCKAQISNLEDLRLAIKDIEKDGINHWFFNHGKFEWNSTTLQWDWTSNKENVKKNEKLIDIFEYPENFTCAECGKNLQIIKKYNENEECEELYYHCDCETTLLREVKD